MVKLIKFVYINSYFFLGRPSVLLRDEHHATNGGDAIIDMDHASMKQQLQVIDESV